MSKAEEIIATYNQYVMPTYSRSLVLVKGKGTKVWDVDGKEYLDFIAGISVCNVGHCHPKVTAAIRNQAKDLVHVSNLYYTENQGRLAEKLSKHSLGGKCFFCNSGAEANEGLIKLARLWGHDKGKYEVITMKNSFHGRTLATAAATGQAKIQKGFEPMPEGFHYAEFNNLESVRALITGKTAAVLVEAVQGEGGIVPAKREFMTGLRALCDEKGILMLCDEVQCGMGRTGQWFAFQAYGVQPDAFSMAKALGSGFPIGAIAATPAMSDVFQPGNHASTFGGTPLACAAALATIEVMEEKGLVDKAATRGRQFVKGLKALKAKYPCIQEIRSAGLMIGMALDRPAKPLVGIMNDMGLITLATAETVVRFLPPLTVSPAEIKQALQIIDKALAKWIAA
jgi:predicted acetylornithine/succinylornithine family transaminase